MGSTGLPPLDPFADLSPFMETAGSTEALSLTLLFPEELHYFRGNDENHSNDDHSEWESACNVSNNVGDKDDMHNKAFDVLHGLQNLKMELSKRY